MSKAKGKKILQGSDREGWVPGPWVAPASRNSVPISTRITARQKVIIATLTSFLLWFVASTTQAISVGTELAWPVWTLVFVLMVKEKD